MEPKKMMGLDDPGAQRVSIAVRDWDALKLALWRSKVAWDIATRAATEIVASCEHKDGCPGKDDEAAPCLSDRYKDLSDGGAELVEKGCPDRETRMSALVILGAARMFAPADARRSAEQRFFAPTREYFSEVMAELAASQTELDALYAAIAAAGVKAPEPPPRPSTLTLPRRPSVAQLPEST